jgi:alpha-glucosidase
MKLKLKKTNHTENWVWWKHGIVYHIYVRSFKDSNGDGIGDLQGIILKLDYLSDLGIHAIWLSPVYNSPNFDFGYDVSDYRKINPEYGTLKDLRQLVKEAHNRGIRVIMDLIMNHTSIEHPWFIESASSKLNPKSDWYLWREHKGGYIPNNWKSAFGGTGWEWNEKRKQFYYHSFFKEQADLNWHNEDLQKAFFKEVKFWLRFGIDGFRLDVINFVAKDKKLRDNPSFFGFFKRNAQIFNRNRPASFKVVKKLRTLLDSYPDKMAVGEIYTTPPGSPSLAASYLGNGKNALHLAFNFSMVFRVWNARTYLSGIKEWLNSIPKSGWPCFVFSNHDLHRSINRLGTGIHKVEKAKVLAVLLLTVKGTPFIYYGEEIGMPNIRIPKKEIKDPIGKKYWPIYSGRDGSRAPMRWNNYTCAGFTEGTPWLPLGPEIGKINVRSQSRDTQSIFQVYKNVIEIRNRYPALQMGKWKQAFASRSGILAYYRLFKNQKILVILNFTNSNRKIEKMSKGHWKLLFSTHRETWMKADNQFELLEFEAIVLLKK